MINSCLNCLTKIVKAVFTATLFVVSFVALATNDVSHLQNAQVRFEANDFQHAVIHLKNSLKLEPETRNRARLLLAESYLNLKQPVLAEVQLLLVKSKTTTPTAWLNWLLINAYLQQGKFYQVATNTNGTSSTNETTPNIAASIEAYTALAAYLATDRQLVEQTINRLEFNNSPSASLVKVLIAIEGERFTDALSYLNSVLRDDPNNVIALFYTALVHQHLGNSELALECLAKILLLQPNHSGALILKTLLEYPFDYTEYSQSGFTSVINQINVSYSIQGISPLNLQSDSVFPLPKNSLLMMSSMLEHLVISQIKAERSKQSEFLAKSQLVAGLLDYELGNYQQAQVWFAEYATYSSKDKNLNLLLASAMLKSGQGQPALKTLLDLRLKGGNSVALYMMLAQAYLSLNDISKAEQSFNQVLKLSPGFQPALLGLGKIYLFTGNLNRVTQLFGSAVNNQEYALYLGSELLFIVASAFKELDQYEQALKVINHIHLASPNDSYAYQLRGSLLGLSGKVQQAQASYIKAQELDPTNFQVVIHLARLALAQGQYQQAVTLIQQQLRAGSNSALFVELGDIFQQLNNSEQAKANYISAINHNPKSVLAIRKLIKLLLVIEGEEKALAAGLSHLPNVPNSAEIRELVAELYVRQNQLEQAIKEFELAAKHSSNPSVILVKVAQLYLQTNNRQQAIANLENSISAQPNNTKAFELLISIYIEDGNEPLALRTIERYGELTNDKSLSHQLKGDLFWRLKQDDIAKKYYQWSMQVKPNRLSALGLYRIYSKLQQFTDARQVLTNWLAINPTDLLFAITLAESFHQNGELERAQQQYEQLVTQTPNNPLVLNNAAIIEAKLTNLNKALDLVTKADELQPNNANILDTKGWILLQLEQTDLALSILEQAQSLSPNSAEVKYHLALVLDKLQRRAEALVLLQESVISTQDFYDKALASDLLKQWQVP